MTARIVFSHEGRRIVISPAPGISIERAAQDVPEGTPYEVMDAAAVPELPGPVPERVSKLQLVRELRDRPFAGTSMWAAFKAQLAQDPVAQEDWDLANYIERDHPMTPLMGLAFQLDEDGLDQLFRDADNR